MSNRRPSFTPGYEHSAKSNTRWRAPRQPGDTFGTSGQTDRHGQPMQHQGPDTASSLEQKAYQSRIDASGRKRSFLQEQIDQYRDPGALRGYIGDAMGRLGTGQFGYGLDSGAVIGATGAVGRDADKWQLDRSRVAGELMDEVAMLDSQEGAALGIAREEGANVVNLIADSKKFTNMLPGGMSKSQVEAGVRSAILRAASQVGWEHPEVQNMLGTAQDEFGADWHPLG